jgi:hypothetical protein
MATNIETIISQVTNYARQAMQDLQKAKTRDPEFILDRQFKRGMATTALQNLLEEIAAIQCAREDEILPRERRHKRASEPLESVMLPPPHYKCARLRRASSGQ